MVGAKRVRRPVLNLHWLTAVGVNWLVIAAMAALACYTGHLAAYLLAAFVIGTRQHALAVLLHDATHFHVSRSKAFNDLLANLFVAWPMAFSSSGYRRWHLQHHRSVGTDADPELMMYRMFGNKWSPDANRVRLYFTDLVGMGSYELLVLWYDLLQWRPAEPKRRLVGETAGLLLWPAVMATLLVALLGWRSGLAVALLWYGSLFTSFFAVYRLRCYSEHVGSDWTHRLDRPPLWQRLLYLPANTWMHWEHHTWPAIPLRQISLEVPQLEAARQTMSSAVPARRNDALTGTA